MQGAIVFSGSNETRVPEGGSERPESAGSQLPSGAVKRHGSVEVLVRFGLMRFDEPRSGGPNQLRCRESQRRQPASTGLAQGVAPSRGHRVFEGCRPAIGCAGNCRNGHVTVLERAGAASSPWRVATCLNRPGDGHRPRYQRSATVVPRAGMGCCSTALRSHGRMSTANNEASPMKSLAGLPSISRRVP